MSDRLVDLGPSLGTLHGVQKVFAETEGNSYVRILHAKKWELADFRHDPADFLALLMGDTMQGTYTLDDLERSAGVRLPESLRGIEPTPADVAACPGRIY